MKVVVVSDSHGRDDLLYDLQEQYPNADAFLHCGDVEAPQENFPGYLIVQGNNDYYYDLPAHRVLPLGGHRVLLIHSSSSSKRTVYPSWNSLSPGTSLYHETASP